MKTFVTIIAILIVAVIGANFVADLLQDRPVTKEYFEEKIGEVNVKLDSLAGEVRNLRIELSAESDTVKNEVRSNGAKLDRLQEDVDAIKKSTSKIEFKLF